MCLLALILIADIDYIEHYLIIFGKDYRKETV
ncbi:hypothetical protein HDE69_001266 [Pedobacter cryoconitis]|uniref:Uncharacterized protein n=1 Tax=Pedobacter cryoconitis TaxID=188932 RepID=A0A7W9DIK3_9SPHI|nr:hypothetical protein [Pedobacter cryoconitis]MBB5648353.1 hypothetical protein [Pedobacter cryoconitis]